MQDEASVCVTLLHHVIEDTAVTLEELKKIFPSEIPDALQLLLCDATMKHLDYLRAIKKNRIALVIKLAGLAHNTDESRLVGSEQRTTLLSLGKNRGKQKVS